MQYTVAGIIGLLQNHIAQVNESWAVYLLNHVNGKITIIPEHQNMQVQQPHRTSNKGQALHADICSDHMLKHHQHPSIPTID